MNKIKLITDSSCDLNKDIIEKYNIHVVPLNVHFGEDTYMDGELDKKEFYDRMSTSKELPKTSCPSLYKTSIEFVFLFGVPGGNRTHN